MAGSILSDTKKALGLADDYTAFDPELIMFINSVMSDLNQLGIGPEAGYAIANSSDTWDELISDELRLNSVQSYVFLKVKMLFDPPSIGYVITAMEKLIEEATWRITVAQDEIKHPPTIPNVDAYDNVIIIDGGVG